MIATKIPRIMYNYLHRFKSTIINYNGLTKLLLVILFFTLQEPYIKLHCTFDYTSVNVHDYINLPCLIQALLPNLGMHDLLKFHMMIL